jgi:uncharacterized protein YdeI (YjbR/CyaY-like superfamily)
VNPLFFENQMAFRQWLEANHKTANELWVGFYKVHSTKHNMTWSQSVDQALCFGWIDGIRKSIDGDSYCIRFTPRKKTSNWSAVNIIKVNELSRQGLMAPAGLDIFNQRKQEKSEIYSYENKPEKLSTDLEKRFKSNAAAWVFFSNQAPSYRKTALYWVMDAKRDATRTSRLEKLIKACEEGIKLF